MSQQMKSIAHVEFPTSQSVEINMMPIIMGDIDSLPPMVRAYQSLIDACDLETTELGKVGYLTVTETIMCPGRSQRRPGLHTERIPTGRWGATGPGGGWGRGSACMGGLYMASNQDGTTAIWDQQVEPGLGGDVEHLRSELGSPYVLSANELVWLTDSCPHESLPTTKNGMRQFFRLVTSQVDLWYTQHSTPNPLGIHPPASVQLISDNKFEVAL